ncbi:MAG: hypothetical protein QGG64_09080, partial [Candidatus Latescibacteria bacterium]|nr:hypothetical protein [Candidatus Latescibacterota bacterium]
EISLSPFSKEGTEDSFRWKESGFLNLASKNTNNLPVGWAFVWLVVGRKGVRGRGLWNKRRGGNHAGW